MGGAEMHCRTSGLGDCLVDDDQEAIAAIRVWLSYLPSNWEEKPPVAPSIAAPAGRSVKDIVPPRESEVYDVHELIDAVADEGTFFPYKDLFAQELVTGFIRLDGHPIGIVANQSIHRGGVLFGDSSDKAARFIWICNAYNVPLIFLVDIAGYMIGSEVERQGIIRHGAKMLFAVAESRVPRIAVLVRKAYGGGYLAMSGAPMQPDSVIALPTAKLALMGPDAAVNGIHYNRIQAIKDPEERRAFIAEKQAEYAEGIDVFKIANENAVDAIVQSNDLRRELISRMAVYRKRPLVPVERRQAVTPV